MYTDRFTFLVKIGDGSEQHLNKEAQPVSLTTVVVHIDDHGLGRHTLHSPGMKQDVTQSVFMATCLHASTDSRGAHRRTYKLADTSQTKKMGNRLAAHRYIMLMRPVSMEDSLL